MVDVPELDIVFVDSDAFPYGLGEPPFIPVAPAIGNTVLAATGQRFRDLPIRLVRGVAAPLCEKSRICLKPPIFGRFSC